MAKATRYTREQLLASKRFAGYQKDFLKAALTQDTYTIKEAEAAVHAVFGPPKKERD